MAAIKARALWGKNLDPLEKDIEKSVKEYARGLGILVRKYSSPNQCSVPDNIFMFNNGVIVFVEFKRKKKKPTKAQAEEHLKMRLRGCNVFVIDNKEDGKQLIKDWHGYASSIAG